MLGISNLYSHEAIGRYIYIHVQVWNICRKPLIQRDKYKGVHDLYYNSNNDMRYICVLRKENDEQGSNLANQVCHWKDEMISVEINIKITGNGCTFANGKQNKNDPNLRLTA